MPHNVIQRLSPCLKLLAFLARLSWPQWRRFPDQKLASSPPTEEVCSWGISCALLKHNEKENRREKQLVNISAAILP